MQHWGEMLLLKVQKCLSSNAIKRLKCYFKFVHIEKEEILKEIKSFYKHKAIQDTDVTTKIIKENADIFSDFLLENINNCVRNSVFP